MLRELNDVEMGMVSGGFGEGPTPPPGLDEGSWEWQWALSDPLVMSQLLGGVGYTGDVDVGGTGEYVTTPSDGSSLFGPLICILATVPCNGDNQGGTPPR